MVDNILLSQQLNFTNRENYSYRWWHSDIEDINKKCMEFDIEFNTLLEKNREVMKLMNLRNISELIRVYAREKLNKI